LKINRRKPDRNRRDEFSEAWAIYRPVRACRRSGDKEPLDSVPVCQLTVSMSRNRLFLGRLLSSRARLRFTGQIDFHPGIGKL
jgi:hypothetical protein